MTLAANTAVAQPGTCTPCSAICQWKALDVIEQTKAGLFLHLRQQLEVCYAEGGCSSLTWREPLWTRCSWERGSSTILEVGRVISCLERQMYAVLHASTCLHMPPHASTCLHMPPRYLHASTSNSSLRLTSCLNRKCSMTYQEPCCTVYCKICVPRRSEVCTITADPLRIPTWVAEQGPQLSAHFSPHVNICIHVTPSCAYACLTGQMMQGLIPMASTYTFHWQSIMLATRVEP